METANTKRRVRALALALSFVVVAMVSLFSISTSVSALNAATLVTRANTDSAGLQANAVTGNTPAMSTDGRYMTFTSTATNLVLNDTNGVDDAFVKDTMTGITTRVSTDSAGVQGNGASSGSSDISADGRYVVFNSSATNLVASDTNGFGDVFVKDTVTGITTRVSTDSAGVQGNSLSISYPGSLSYNGRYVAFLSVSTNLVAGDTNGFNDIFVKDTITGITTRVSTDSAGVQGNNHAVSNVVAISADGRYVSFTSTATNLVTGDTNGFNDIFVKDTTTGVTTRISTDSSGAQANNASQSPSISADGRYITFDSVATNLVSGDTNAVGDVFVKDTQTGTTTRASTDDAGVQGNAVSLAAIISPDGRFVAFRSDASNLVTSDTNGFRDHFVKDTQTGITARVSTDSTGTNGNAAISGGIAISADNRYITFNSLASNLVTGDTNATSDMFFRQNPLVTFLSNDNFSISSGSTASVLSNDTYNGAPPTPSSVLLSITSNGGLSGAAIASDGTISIPVSTAVGTYVLTYQVCEVAVPASCQTATANISVLGLAETGSNTVITQMLSLLLIIAGTITFRRTHRRKYSAR